MAKAAKRREDSEARLDAIFNALGDRTRRALVARLAKKPARITELAEPFEISLPAVSRHIRVLEAAGLVTREVNGRVHRCSFKATPLAEIESWLQQYLQSSAPPPISQAG